MHKIFDLKQYSLADIVRAIIVLFALYPLFITDNLFAFIKILGVLLLSFLFKFRRTIGIKHSHSADFWEFCGVSFVLASAFIFSFNGFYHPKFSILDLPMHFASGALIAFWAVLAFQSELKKIKGLETFFLLLGAVGLLGAGWEFFEWVTDYFKMWSMFPKAQISLNDTMGDFLFNFLGGAAVYTMYVIKESKQTK